MNIFFFEGIHFIIASKSQATELETLFYTSGELNTVVRA